MNDVHTQINFFVNNIKNKDVQLLVEQNLFEIPLPDLMHIAKYESMDEAQRICFLYKQDLNQKINMIINHCKNNNNLIELKKTIQFGQKNIYVLRLIAESNTPYEIRKGFESGSKLTIENLFGTGYPAYNYLFAMNQEVILPDEVLIITENKGYEPYSNFKKSYQKK